MQGVKVMPEVKPIEMRLCDVYPRIPLGDNFVVRIIDTKENLSLPEDVEARVRTTWNKFTAVKKTATDGLAAYLDSYFRDDQILSEVLVSRYRYTLHFARRDIDMEDTSFADQFKVFPFTTFILIGSNREEKALFGYKHDYGANTVSGFGSIVSANDIPENQASLSHHVNRVLNGELGSDLAQRVTGIYTTGLNFSPTIRSLDGSGEIVGPREFDVVCYVTLDGTIDNLAKLMEANEQFKKELIPVSLDKESLFGFLQNEKFKHTKSCVAGILSYLLSNRDERDKSRLLKEYSKFGRVNVELLSPHLNGVVDKRVTSLF